MNKFHAAIKVLNGIYLSHDECSNLNPGSIPLGEEVTEDMYSAYPISVTDEPSGLASPSSRTANLRLNTVKHAEPLGKNLQFVSPSEKRSILPISSGASASLTLSCLNRPLKRGDSTVQSVCPHLRSSKGAPRSLSVGHLGCIIRAVFQTASLRKTKSLPYRSHLKTSPISTVMHEFPSAYSDSRVEDKPDDTDRPRSTFSQRSYSRQARSVSPTNTRYSTSEVQQRGSFCPSSVRWCDQYSSSSINRKAVFTLDSSLDVDFPTSTTIGDTHDPLPVVKGKHLLLPGRSVFEDELVREVAHFELAEFLIGEIESLNTMMQTATLSKDSTELDGLVSNLTRSMAVEQHDTTQASPVPGGKKALYSSLGFLAFVDPQNPRTIPTPRNCIVQHPTKDEGPNPFADLFGLVQQGLFINTDGPDSTQRQTNSYNASETNSAQQIFSPSSSLNGRDEGDPYGDEMELAQSRVVTTLASDLLTSCLERVANEPSDSPARLFLKDLHQLLVISCDADWAFRSPIGSGRSNATELQPTHTLIPSNSAVLLPLYSDTGGQKVDLVSLDPQYRSHTARNDILQRRRCHSFSTFEYSTAVSPRSTSSALGYCESPMPRSDASVHRATPWSVAPENQSHPLRRDSRYFSLEQPNSLTSSPSLRLESTDLSDRCNPINAICTPLPYDLLTHPPVSKSKRKLILVSQKNCCAGCGLFIETRYLKRMRFCEFFGKYFCCVCHTNTLMALPGNVLTAWDFRMLPVSNIARDRLNQLHQQPLLRLSDFNPRVLQNQAALRNCFTLRKQGNLILPFVQFCLDAQGLVSSLQSLPIHWLSNPDLWSMADFCAVRDGQLDSELRRILQPIVDHLSACSRCRAQGFVCEICHSGQILFPFGQVNTVSCPVCMACFHRACLRNPKPSNCPRCIRRALRRQQQQQSPHRREDPEC